MIQREQPRLPWSGAPGLAMVGIMPAMLGVVLALGNPLASNPLISGEAVIPGGATASVSADALVAQAQALRQAGDLVTARELLLTALQRDPSHVSARTLLTAIDSQDTGRPAPLDGDPAGGDLQIQATLAEARMQTARAELLAAGNRFEDAIVLLAQSLEALKPLSENQVVRTEIQRIAALQGQYQERQLTTRDRDARAARQSDRESAEARTRHHQNGEAALVSERIARIEELERKGFIESALASCRRLVDSYPSDRRVGDLFARLLKRSHVQRELTIEEQRAELLQETHERLERSLIPTGFDGWPDFPTDWHTRHTVRGDLDAPVKLESWEAAINEKLSARLSYNLVEQNAVEVLTALAKQVGVNLVIDPAVFANGDVVVTLKANDITFRNTLSWICRLANTRWYVDRGAVFVGGTQESTPVLAIYDVSELLFVPKDQAGKQLAFGGGATGGGAGGNPGFSLFAAPADEDSAPALSPEDLVDLIQQAVSPTVWENEAYNIAIRGTTLLVNAPTSTHLLIQEFIRSQANQKSLLVRVNARWLTIKDGYLEEIGVDWRSDLFLRPNALAPTPLQVPNAGPHAGVTTTSSGYHRITNQFDHGGSLVNTLPANASTPNSAIQAAGGGLNLQAMLVDSTLSSAILSAVERSTKGTILEAPEVVTMSGVRANTFMGTQYAYISDYEASPPAGALGGTLDPDIGVLNLGAALDIKPYVSADGKYVTMEFRPAIASLQGSLLETITTQRFIPTGVGPGGGGNGNGVIVGNIITQEFSIELPNVLVRSVATTIMVPDGGTILVGGFGNVIEQSTSTKIPFLGHIPFLGRLFGKRGRFSDRYQLYLLADIHIINYAELEAKL